MTSFMYKSLWMWILWQICEAILWPSASLVFRAIIWRSAVTYLSPLRMTLTHSCVELGGGRLSLMYRLSSLCLNLLVICLNTGQPYKMCGRSSVSEQAGHKTSVPRLHGDEPQEYLPTSIRALVMAASTKWGWPQQALQIPWTSQSLSQMTYDSEVFSWQSFLILASHASWIILL